MQAHMALTSAEAVIGIPIVILSYSSQTEQVLQALPFEGEVLFCDLSAGLSVHAGSGVAGVVAVVAE